MEVRTNLNFDVSHVTIESVDLQRLNSTELQLIVAAMLEYRKALQETLDNVKEQREDNPDRTWTPDDPRGLVSGGYEDEAFAYTELAKVSRFLYELVYDNDPRTPQTARMRAFIQEMV